MTAREHCNRGAVLHLEGDLEGAGREYAQALADDPGNATALNNMGFLQAGEGRFADAIGFYRQAVAAAPERAMAHANLGQAHAALGELRPALDELGEAVRLDGGNVIARDGLARVLLAL